jgi:CheY-like chemotaxis protein
MKILLIEDVVYHSNVVIDILEYRGHEVVLKNNSDDAVDEIPKIESYDSVILDLMMMRGSKITSEELNRISKDADTGIAIYKRIRAKNKQIPILINTARDKGMVWDYFKHDDNVEFYPKPLRSNVDKFIALVEEAK